MPIDSIGATGAVVARNISRLRRDQGLAYTELSKRLSELGRPIPTLGLRKIESGGRRVDVDDVIALSLALAVSPITLFMPYPLDDAGELLDVPGVREPQEASRLWSWLRADDWLIEADDLHDWVSFARSALPRWVLRDVADYMKQELDERRRDRRGNDQ